VTALREPLGANMEYKNYEEWKAEGEKVQAELIRVDEQRRQARIDGDDNAYVRLEDEYNRLLIQSRDHMAKMPLRSVALRIVFHPACPQQIHRCTPFLAASSMRPLCSSLDPEKPVLPPS